MHEETNYLHTETNSHFSNDEIQYFPDVYTTSAGQVKSPLQIIETIRTKDWRYDDQEILRSGALSEKEIRLRKTHYPNVTWHAKFYPCIDAENLQSFTGFALLDIDDIEEKEIEDVKNEIAALPFVIMVYRSTTFGVHAIIRVDGIQSFEDYEYMYHQLSTRIYNQLGYKLCDGACNTTQRTYLPYDPAIMFNEHATTFKYVFDKSSEDYYQEHLKKESKNNGRSGKGLSSGKLKKILADPEIYLDRSHYLYFTKQIEKGYSVNHVVIDKHSGLPELSTSDFTFDYNKHTLAKYFPKTLISNQEWHNKSNTIALLQEPAIAYKILFKKDLMIYSGKRFDMLIAILCGYLFIQKVYEKPVSKSKLYSLAFCLNEQCLDEHGNKFPVIESELKSITSFAYQHYTNNTLSPKFSTRSSICNKHFIDERINENEAPLIVYKRLLNELKNASALYRWTEIKKRALLFIQSRKIEIKSQNHFCRLVSDLADINFETVKYHLSRKKHMGLGGGQVKEQDNIESSYSIIGEFTQVTPLSYFDKVKDEYYRLVSQKRKPTARLIAENLSIYIDTAKKHLAEVRRQIKESIQKDNFTIMVANGRNNGATCQDKNESSQMIDFHSEEFRNQSICESSTDKWQFQFDTVKKTG